MSALTMAIVCGTAGCAVSHATPLPLGSLAIYYGWPGLINNAKDTDTAIHQYACYDAIVFGRGLEDEKHGNHTQTRQIIAKLRKRTRVFGYIPLGSKSALSQAAIERAILTWKRMGIAGIFFDEAGYDFGNTRNRQNAAFSRARRAGLSVFANAWNPDDLFGRDRSSANPQGSATVLRQGDAYLYESFGVIMGKEEPLATREQKLEKLEAARRLGVKIYGVVTSHRPRYFNQDQWRAVISAAKAARLDGVGWGEYLFSAQDNLLPLRKR